MWRLRSRDFRQWMARRFFEETESVPNSEALHAALNVIEARASFDAPERKVHTRVGGSTVASISILGTEPGAPSRSMPRVGV
jgi:hypothetical protein